MGNTDTSMRAYIQMATKNYKATGKSCVCQSATNKLVVITYCCSC